MSYYIVISPDTVKKISIEEDREEQEVVGNCYWINFIISYTQHCFFFLWEPTDFSPSPFTVKMILTGPHKNILDVILAGRMCDDIRTNVILIPAVRLSLLRSVMQLSQDRSLRTTASGPTPAYESGNR